MFSPERTRPRVVRHPLPLAIATALSLLLSTHAFATNDPRDTDDEASATDRDRRVTPTTTLPPVKVTARKSTESLKDVPASITVVSAQDMAQAPLDPQVAITQKSANVIWNTFGSTQGFYAIRGISSLGAPVNNWDGTVGFTIDGVPTSMLGLSTALVDVDRVEVLRGPQGTLWGANALGGAINIGTHQPDGQRDIHVTTEIGSDGYRTGEAVVAGNLVPDTLDGRIAVKVSRFDGDIDSLHTGELGRRQVRALRGGLRWSDADTTATLTGNYSRDKSNAPFFLLDGGPGFPTSGSLTEPRQDTSRSGATLNIEHTFDRTRLTSITAFQNNRVDSYVDSTDTLLYDRLGVPRAFQLSAPGVTNDQEKIYSQEVRLGSLENAPVRWVAGTSAIYTDAHRQWSSGGAPAYDTHLRTLNLGWFADATVALTDRWSWSAGGRISHDKTDIEVHNVNATPGSAGRNDTSQNYLTGRTALNYAWSDTVTSYVSVSRGHATQVYELYAVPSQGRLADAFPAATDWTYEMGTQWDVLEHRLQVEGSLFRNDIRNGVLTYLDPTTATFRTMYQSYRTAGFEWQARALLARGLIATAGAGYTHAMLGTDSFATRRVPNIPLWTATAGLQYGLPEHALGVPGTLSLATDYRYVGSRVVDVDDSFSMRSYGLANVTVGWTSPGGNLELSVFARNIADKRYATYGSSLGGIPLVSVGPGRTLGLGATVHL